MPLTPAEREKLPRRLVVEGKDDAHDLMRRHGFVDVRKAELSAWLAWQSTPGLPYGTAIRAGCFQALAANLPPFAAWFRTLFDDSSASSE